MLLSELEKNILDQLASSVGNILQNTKLIQSLNETKQKSIEINKSLVNSKQL